MNGQPQTGFLVKVGGGTSIFPRTGFVLSEFVSVDDYLRLAEAVLWVFDRSDELRLNRMKARLTFHVQRVGIATFRAEVADALLEPGFAGTVDLASFQSLAEQEAQWARRRCLPSTLDAVSSDVSDPDFERWHAANTRPQRPTGYRAVVIRLPVGTITAAQLRGLAEIVLHSTGG